MEGIKELAEKVFEMPVKLGVPYGIGGLTEAAKSPIHATGVGLCMYGLEQQKKPKGGRIFGRGDNFKRIVERMKAWVREFF